jgi:hypothetical protein
MAGEKFPASSDARSESGTVISPSISLPKGGGAIRGIGEKFAANPGHWHGFDDRAHRYQSRAVRLRPPTLALLTRALLAFYGHFRRGKETICYPREAVEIAEYPS